jgi:hypothetical protein
MRKPRDFDAELAALKRELKAKQLGELRARRSVQQLGELLSRSGRPVAPMPCRSSSTACWRACYS